MKTVYKKLYSLLDVRERRRAALVFLLLLIVALAETVGVASIMPFIAVLANPEVIQTNKYLAFLYAFLNLSSERSFLIFLGFVFFALLVVSLILKAVGVWAQLRFSHNRNHAWGARLIGAYLRQPYEWFLDKRSSDLATSVLSEIMQVVNGVLFPAMQAVAQAMVAILLLALLITVDPLLAAAVGGILGGSYLVIAMLLKRKLTRIGAERRIANKSRFRVVQESFSGIKEVKVAGLEDDLVRRFAIPAKIVARRQISAGLISQIPPFAMQGLLFGGMLLALLYLIWRHGSFQQAVPVVALYAFAGYRLMPAIQNIYANVSKFHFAEAALDALCEDFANLESRAQIDSPNPRTEDQSRLHLKTELKLHDVTYSYPNADRAALSTLTLHIPAHSTVGLVGRTGSGKTTTVDLILGLLRPTTGRILIDGIELTTDNIRAWHRSLGYVPQQIFLSDDTVAGNIAFGLREKEIDMAAVERAARAANLHEFITRELSDGYATMVGDRGIRLSGGQRQRIGIARALYHDPDVLVLDEATSALDNVTEKAVMDAIDRLGNRKTIIMIAHRLTTVRNCDEIFLLEAGQLVGRGTYEHLVRQNESFQTMVSEAG